MKAINAWFLETWKAIAHLFDARVFLLMFASLATLYVTKPEMAITLAQSIAYLTFAASLVIYLRKVWLPYVDLEDTLEQVKDGNMAAGLVFLSVTITQCVIMITAVWWILH